MSTTAAMPQWIVEHRAIWDAKPGLRHYYEREYFERVVAALPKGDTLEIGAGPGFFARYHRCSVVSDVTPADHLDRVADVHQLPFADRSFDGVVGIDVIHHIADPARALTEIARILRPNGRLVLIEPWATPLGRLFFRHVHHENCFAIERPWGPVFPAGKDPMDGNAEIPRTYFETLARETETRCGLTLKTVEVFGLFGYLATGGFARFYLGDVLINFFIAVDRWTPEPLRRLISLKALIVAERGTSSTTTNPN
jgi:SAM-dependent methyltransferase